MLSARDAARSFDFQEATTNVKDFAQNNLNNLNNENLKHATAQGINYLKRLQEQGRAVVVKVLKMLMKLARRMEDCVRRRVNVGGEMGYLLIQYNKYQ
jgi:hypothetical protein